MSNNIKLEMCHVSKWFPGVKALNNVSFQVKEGTVKALCGENGAGKSTLMKILAGIYQPDEGEIYIDGNKVEIQSPIRARKLGIAMVFQELSYVPDMSIAENIYLGNWPLKRNGIIDWSAIKKNTIELLKKEELPYSYDTKLKELSISDIQLIEILKAISYDANVIIMDEPTSSLTDRESETLFRKIKELKEKGVSIIYISHKLDEVFRIADEITILRDGATIDTKPIDQIDANKVIELMVGRKIENLYPKVKVEIGNTLLRVENLTKEGVFKNISFDLKEGEIVGLAGLVGAGRTEIVRALYGLDPYDSGKVWIKDREIKITGVKQSISNNMVMVSEDRRRYGIIPMRSVRENVSIASLDKFIYHGRLHKKKELDTAKHICKKMNVKTPSLETTVSALSGGNQQKLILAKWMIRDPQILIVDEPTRGIDVGAKREIFQLMGELVKQKKGILMISSEMMELISICDRIYVVSEGRITGMIHRNEFSQNKIMQLAVNKEGAI